MFLKCRPPKINLGSVILIGCGVVNSADNPIWAAKGSTDSEDNLFKGIFKHKFATLQHSESTLLILWDICIKKWVILTKHIFRVNDVNISCSGTNDYAIDCFIGASTVIYDYNS